EPGAAPAALPPGVEARLSGPLPLEAQCDRLLGQSQHPALCGQRLWRPAPPHGAGDDRRRQTLLRGDEIRAMARVWLCGSLRYEAEGEPSAIGKCYCTDCQKESGTGHMTFVSFPGDAIKVSGEASRYVKKGDSGNEVVRLFCPSCGTTIAGYPKILG